jgi:XTP/dITP diphosphohydrolase
MKLLFASRNKHKTEEVSGIMPNNLEIIGLNELSFKGEVPETQDTIEGNALQKAQFIFDIYGITCFADDTGLFIDALNGEPGVFSARWSTEDNAFQNNIEKALFKLKDKKNRKAYFKTVIVFINREGEPVFFEGKINGEIISSLRGNSGFGYDPIFIPDGFDMTFAEMDKPLKNKISHRGIAMGKFIKYLSENNI